ncbi:MAG: hypothetical protein H0T11_06265 [Chthoniobacterales bacterium]|nr:hypothetical protein [Chthoniobacterales bacterium]
MMRRFALYGVAVELTVELPELSTTIEQLLGDFAVERLPLGLTPLRGTVRPFETRDVLRRLPSNARRVMFAPPGMADRLTDPPEIFQDGERFWIVDERWGMTEIDLLKGRWTSWILTDAQLAPRQCVEAAVHWPLAQLLRGRGLHLLPAASVARAGLDAMIFSPFNVGPELAALIRAGFRLIGQRWTVVRDVPPDINGLSGIKRPIEMCRMPGWVEEPKALSSPFRTKPRAETGFVDLAMEHCGATKARSACNTVIIVQPTRRLTAHLQLVPAGPLSLQSLRADWPIAELHPTRARGQLMSSMARRCAVYNMTLSRNPNDFPDLLSGIAPSARSAITVKLHRPALPAITPSHPILRTA